MSNNPKTAKRNGTTQEVTPSTASADVRNASNGVAPAIMAQGGSVNVASPVEDRLTSVQISHFVNTPTTARVLDRMERLLKYPKQDRMPCILVIGDPNSGKTSLLKKFWAAHPAVKDPADYQDKRPVVYFEVGGPGEGRFFDQALRGIGMAPALSHTPRQKELLFLTHCIKQGVRALVIDEFHNGIEASSREQQKLLVRVRHITNELQIPLVVAGIETAKTFLFSDPQLSSRFILQERIPRWQDCKDYRGFLLSLEEKYKLKKPSKLAQTGALAEKILGMAEGLTGEIVRLIQAASVLAIETGEEQITEKTLASVTWTKPSERHL